MKVLSENRGQDAVSVLPSPHSSSLASPRKEFVPLSGALVFTAAAKGHPYIT